MAYGTFEFRLDAALKSNVAIQAVRPGIRIAALLAHERSAAARATATVAAAAAASARVPTADAGIRATLIVIEIGGVGHKRCGRCDGRAGGGRNSRRHNDFA